MSADQLRDGVTKLATNSGAAPELPIRLPIQDFDGSAPARFSRDFHAEAGRPARAAQEVD